MTISIDLSIDDKITHTYDSGLTFLGDESALHSLDLHKFLIKHPNATYFMRTSSSFSNRLSEGASQILIVDRSLKPTDGSLIVVVLDESLVLSRVHMKSGQIVAIDTSMGRIKSSLALENLTIWGVITHSINDHIHI